jgi:hypothetical protein
MPDDKGFDLSDLGELADKAKDLVGDHADEVKDGIGTVADLVGDHLGVDEKTVRSVEQTAKGFVDDLDADQAPAKAKRSKPSTSKKRSSKPSTDKRSSSG